MPWRHIRRMGTGAMFTENDSPSKTGGGASTVRAEVASESRPIFAIFEGGGAKGIAHVDADAAADGTPRPVTLYRRQVRVHTFAARLVGHRT
ncbi:MAG: hypothetical protein M3N97_01795 [Pseudomonadota bacterium]|nr:hypothetical protein [Pseudomonadota bacterium]